MELNVADAAVEDAPLGIAALLAALYEQARRIVAHFARNDGQLVDYQLLLASQEYLDLAQLLSHVRAARSEDVAGLSELDRLCLFVNLYNLLVLHAVASRLHAASTMADDSSP